MVFIEVMVSSARLTLISKLSHTHDQIYDVEVLELRRHTVEKKWIYYQK